MIIGPGPIEAGYARVLPTSLYTSERGYGFEAGGMIEAIDRGGKAVLERNFCSSTKPPIR